MDMLLEINPNERPKRPTLLQWLKTKSSTKLRSKYHCEIVFFPGDYPTITFQTESFRVVVYENSPIFDKCLDLARELGSTDTPFAIVVGAERDGSFGITSSGEKGVWEPIGEIGMKWVPDRNAWKSSPPSPSPKPRRSRKHVEQIEEELRGDD